MSNWRCGHEGLDCKDAAACAAKLTTQLTTARKDVGDYARKAGIAKGELIATEMNHRRERREIWDAAIEEAAKKRIVFVQKKDILSMDLDMKIRLQMRNEIVKALGERRDAPRQDRPGEMPISDEVRWKADGMEIAAKIAVRKSVLWTKEEEAKSDDYRLGVEEGACAIARKIREVISEMKAVASDPGLAIEFTKEFKEQVRKAREEYKETGGIPFEPDKLTGPPDPPPPPPGRKHG